MRKALALFAVLAFVSTLFAGCTHFTGKTAGQSFDDTIITGDIKTKIMKDPELKTFAVDVSSYQGNVTLSGMVPNRAAEQRLILYAQDTKGVKSIRTNLRMAGAAPGATAGGTPSGGSTMAAPVTPAPGTAESSMGTQEKGSTAR
jgi:predicted small secreted protein